MNLKQWYEHLPDILNAIQDGKSIECAESPDSKEWTPVSGTNLRIDRVYRVKQQVRICNGVELPQCITSLTGKGYVAYPLSREMYWIPFGMVSPEERPHLFEQGLVYATAEDATIHAKAMLKVVE